MTTIYNKIPPIPEKWKDDIKDHLISYGVKVAAGSLIGHNPVDMAVAYAAQQSFLTLGKSGIKQLENRLSPQMEEKSRIANFCISVLSGFSIATFAGFNPTLVAYTMGLCASMYVALKEDPFKKDNEIINLTKDNFLTEVETSTIPVIIDVYATWCLPCKIVAPNYKKVAAEFNGQVKFLKMNIDQQPELAKKLNVNQMPTFLFFNKGIEQYRESGILNPEDFKKYINSIIETPVVTESLTESELSA